MSPLTENLVVVAPLAPLKAGKTDCSLRSVDVEVPRFLDPGCVAEKNRRTPRQIDRQFPIGNIVAEIVGGQWYIPLNSSSMSTPT